MVGLTLYAHVAQAEEHILGKDEVTGSIPVVGSEMMCEGNKCKNPKGGING